MEQQDAGPRGQEPVSCYRLMVSAFSSYYLIFLPFKDILANFTFCINA